MKSAVPNDSTVQPGRNFIRDGVAVAWVWMNMANGAFRHGMLQSLNFNRWASGTVPKILDLDKGWKEIARA